MKDTSKLPQWAQRIIHDQEITIKELEARLSNAEKANEITSKMDWYTLGIHTEETRPLYVFNRDQPQRVGYFGKDSVILVGNPKARS